MKSWSYNAFITLGFVAAIAQDGNSKTNMLLILKT